MVDSRCGENLNASSVITLYYHTAMKLVFPTAVTVIYAVTMVCCLAVLAHILFAQFKVELQRLVLPLTNQLNILSSRLVTTIFFLFSPP